MNYLFTSHLTVVLKLFAFCERINVLSFYFALVACSSFFCEICTAFYNLAVIFSLAFQRSTCLQFLNICKGTTFLYINTFF